MRLTAWNLLLATWLLVSALALPNGPSSQAVTGAAAVAIGVLAVVARGRAAARFAIAGIAAFVALAALLPTDRSTAAAVSDAVAAAILFALSVAPRAGAPTPAVKPGDA